MVDQKAHGCSLESLLIQNLISRIRFIPPPPTPAILEDHNGNEADFLPTLWHYPG